MLIGTAYSVLIRLELSGPGVQFIADNQLYNSIITSHAILMIFFMVNNMLMLNTSPVLSVKTHNTAAVNTSSVLSGKVNNINNKNLNLVIWGTNLRSTVGTKFKLNQLAIVQLAPYQYSVVIGLLLSDGWLIIASRSTNARLGFKQSLNHSEYVLFVFNILSHYCSSNPHFITSITAGTRCYALQFYTRSMPCLTELHYLFYPNGVKIIPKNIFELLTPIALAHLIMGDGSVTRHGLILCTNSYSVQDVVRLMNVLIIRYRLECNIRLIKQKKIEYMIYIQQDSMTSLLNIVSSYMHPSMLYKLESAQNKIEGKGKPRPEGAGKPSKAIEVIDIKNNITTSYGSISEAAKALNINHSSIAMYFTNNQQKPYKGRYIFKNS